MSVQRLVASSEARLVLPSHEAVDALDAEGLVEFLTRLGALTERARARLSMANGVAKSAMSDPSSLLTVEELATRLHVSKDYVYGHAGKWPFTRRVGRKLLFLEAGLTRWLEARRGIS